MVIRDKRGRDNESQLYYGVYRLCVSKTWSMNFLRGVQRERDLAAIILTGLLNLNSDKQTVTEFKRLKLERKGGDNIV